jgi:hypothetical protein
MRREGEAQSKVPVAVNFEWPVDELTGALGPGWLLASGLVGFGDSCHALAIERFGSICSFEEWP